MEYYTGRRINVRAIIYKDGKLLAVKHKHGDNISHYYAVPGGGLDAHARRGVSTQFISAVMTVVLAFALIFTIGVGRVVLSTMTVSKLQANNETRTALRQMTAENDNLRISRSLLSSNTRIEKIATQRYGMKLSENRAVLNVNNSPQA